MKNFLLLFCFTGILSFSASSQSLTLSDSQGPIPNNSTVTPHGNSGSDEIIAYAYVTNHSSVAIPVKVKKVEVYLTPGTTNTFCWGLCYNPSVYVSLQTITIDPGKTDSSDFSGHLLPNGISGYDLIRYVFYNESNPTDSVCMIVDYIHFPVGMESSANRPTLSGPVPNPADDNFRLDYMLPGDETGKIIICNSSGMIVKEMSLPCKTGSIRVSTIDLKDGVYFYSLYAGGKMCSTKKIIVKH